ncbi:cation:proton antiporter [Streptomyces sp. NPDC041068]|uniref:cation:proton antiporter n=1 Tax=Streptomyces sp. NPDC041068 TaxID=3155130 RepID=UPI0033C4F009
MAADTSGHAPGRRYRMAAAVAWAVVVPLALIGFLVVHVMSDGAGEPLPQARTPHREDLTGHFLLAAAVVLVACRLGGTLMRRLRQPAVMGEICAGLALGPSLLGQAAPDAAHWLFPASSLPLLDGLAQLGLVLFMFEVGRELAHVRMRGGTLTRAVLVSHASLLIPFAGGAAAAVALWATGFGTGDVLPVVFVLFVGCACSVTAFPVLARILADLGRTRTEPGRLSLFAAAVGDGAGWLVLAALLAGAGGSGAPGRLLFNALSCLALVALFLGPIRRLLACLPALNDGRSADIGTTTGLVAGIAATSALTAALGVHQLIGAMLVGLAWPVRGRPAGPVARRLGRSATSTLLPFFFFEFGLHTDLSTLRWDRRTVLVLLGLTCLATVTKVVGPAVAARLTGMSWRSACTLGVLLNARGLTELVVLQAGYQAGIIDERLLGILTLVALVTTAMTSVLLRCGPAASRHEHRKLRGQREQHASVGDEGMRTGQPV